MATVGTEDYQLSTSLEGHCSDIKGIEPLPWDTVPGLVTASRDKTAIIWSSDDRGYKISHTVRGHSDFVSCITITPPNSSARHPEGLIYTGSFDCTIRAYTIAGASPLPIYTLRGHKKPVSSLSSNSNGYIISGSWDHKAIVWHEDRCIEEMNDHSETVWATAFMPDGEIMITGSADKTIKVWKLGIGLQSTFSGHEACIRAIAVTGKQDFLSGCNDGKIFHWNTTTGLISKFDAHDNFIYSISSRGNGEEWASTSEDGTLKVWRKNQIAQTIILPMVTPWVVKYLKNGDLAVGGSDAICRIFTQSTDRVADAGEVEALNEAVRKKLKTSSLNVDDAIDINTLSGPEALHIPGTRANQQKIIQENGLVVIYQWDEKDGRWNKIGDVTGVNSKKKLHDGKEYDYVIDVEVEGQPPLKLAINKDQDPWVVAQHFLFQHNLPQTHLDTMANFIVTNTEVRPKVAPDASYQDPFTGTDRYIPGAPQNPERASAGPTSSCAGPSRSIGGQASSVNGSETLNKYTITSYISMDEIKIPQVINKLVSLNQSRDLGFSKSEIEALGNLVVPESCTAELWASLKKLLNQWPPHINFPLLDILRVAVSFTRCLDHLEDKDWLHVLLRESVCDETSDVNTVLMCYRTISNMIISEKDKTAIAEIAAIALNGIPSKPFRSGNVRLQVTISTCAINYALYLDKSEKSNLSRLKKIEFLKCLIRMVKIFSEESCLNMLCRALCILIRDDGVINSFSGHAELVETLMSVSSRVSSTHTKEMIDCFCCSLQRFLPP